MTFDTRMYLGRPGLLAAIGSPRGKVEAVRQRRTSVFELGAGGYSVDQMIGGARTYTINYEQITRENWATLQAFADSHEGPGPFAFLDPGQRNMLPANMSAATSSTNDTTNFMIAGSGCTIGSSSLYVDAGPRTLRWTFAHGFPGATAALTPTWPSSVFTYGVPVVSGRALCFSAYVRGGGTDQIVTYTPQIVWRDSAGGVVSTSSGTPVVSDGSLFTRAFATGTAPAGSYYADWKIAYTSGAGTNAIGFWRRFLLNEGSTPDTVWTPGTGVWPVRVVTLPESWPYLSPELRTGPVLTLQEDTS